MSDIVVKPNELGTPKVKIHVNVTGGTDGATFTPSVSEDGVLSWSNNAGLENPDPVDVKGPKGDPGKDSATHIADGAASGSIRTTGSAPEGDAYKLGINAFASGLLTKAQGEAATAQGMFNRALERASYVEGIANVANSEAQHVQGRYSAPLVKNKYAHVVGNGTDYGNTSNAHVLDWDGNAWFAGNVFVGGADPESKDKKILATQEYVDGKMAEIPSSGVSSWNDLTDKPFYEADEEVTILPEATYTIDADSGDAYILNPPSADVVVGNTYTVNWNGTEYSCIAQSFELDGVPVVVLGDIGVMTGGDSTGEPFVIIMFPADLAASVGAYGAIMALDGSASPSMSISTILETIHKLDNKYLDMAWVPTAEAEAEMEFIPAQTTSSTGQILIRNSDIDLTMFAAGAKVAIYIDNDRYEATVTQNEQFFIAGNMSLMSGSGAPDTGEPYLIIVGGEYVQVTVSPAAEHEVAVCVFQYGQNKLPYDFLPHVVVTKGYVVETAKELRSIIPSNLVNGSAVCSVRTVNSAEEADDYNIGSDSVALGRGSRASGVGAFAFGNEVSASGRSSHAEGEASEAAGNYSHAEGEATKANGLHSHVEGLNTYAGGRCQHVQGMYNIKDDEDKYLHIVGNGKADNARSNAHTLDWDGNAWFAGTIFLGGTGQDDTAAVKLDDHINSLIDAKIAAIPNAEEASF